MYKKRRKGYALHLAVLICLIGLAGVYLSQRYFMPAVNASPNAALTVTPVATAVPTEEVYMSALPNLGPAPEIESLAWLNSTIPLRLANLRGSVVLLEFWTYDCINCMRTLPYIEQWHQTYQDRELVVMGIHYPEFNYERDLQNVFAATARLNVTYAVGLDNDGATWQAYNQRYWPTTYLIDKMGNIRYYRIGEGAYSQTEQAINDLLAETYSADDSATEAIELTYLTPDVVLNVRSGAGIENARIGSINPGMSFMVLSVQNDWYEIRYNDGVGFVSAEYVTVTDQSNNP